MNEWNDCSTDCRVLINTGVLTIKSTIKSESRCKQHDGRDYKVGFGNGKYKGAKTPKGERRILYRWRVYEKDRSRKA